MPFRVRAVASLFAIPGIVAGCLAGDVIAADPSVPRGALRTRGTLAPWTLSGTNVLQAFETGIDHGLPRSGTAAAYLTATPAYYSVADAASISQSVSAVPFRGQRVRWSAWVRTTAVEGNGAGLWMRVDGPGGPLAFDNMSPRAIRGTTDWTRHSVVLDVSPNAANLHIGVLLNGPGDVLIDDGWFEVVDKSVPVTDLFDGSNRDTIPGVSPPFIDRPNAVNLDFEGMTAFSDQMGEWLRTVARPFTSIPSGGDDADLAPFRAMIGDARVVALGETTRGTREHFTLKHRIFESLVRHEGFTHFAIEGAWGEANEINHHVRTGEGEPARLLSRLGSWTLNTQEVLDLIQWMRSWNSSASPSRQVQFLGFDMQAISLPADSVETFVRHEMPAVAAFMDSSLECLQPFRRTEGSLPRPVSEYASLSGTIRQACRAGLDSLQALLDGYTGDVPAERLAQVRQSARVLRQWERMSGDPVNRTSIRDSMMADNVNWLLGQAPAGTRMTLWTHNQHVSMESPRMGSHLRRMHGDRYRGVGLFFLTGTFNALATGATADQGPQRWNAHSRPALSIESAFAMVGFSPAMLDARLVANAPADIARILRGPIMVRSIGAGFDPVQEAGYFRSAYLPEHFDHLLYVQTSTPTTLLPSPPVQ